MALSPDALLTVGRRDVRDSERIVQLKDRQARILPKYRQRRRQSAVDWTPLELSSSAQRDDDDAVTSMLNDADVQAPTTDAQRSKHLLKPAESDQSQKPVGPSAEDFLGLLQPLTTIAVDDNVVDDNTANGLTTTLRFSNGDDYNIDIDEELNASSRLMLSRLFASNTLPGNGNGEPARITESSGVAKKFSRGEHKLERVWGTEAPQWGPGAKPRLGVWGLSPLEADDLIVKNRRI